MSAVSGSNNGSSQDESRRIREEARKREAELIKKNSKQVSAADKKHAEEIKRLEEQTNARLQNLRDKSSEAITRRDQKYQQEMDEIRNLHTKQLERLMADNEDKVEVLRETAKRETKQTNLGKEDRTQELHENYGAEIEKQKKDFSTQIESMRDKQKESSERTRKELDDAHNKEMESFRDFHNEKTAELKNDLRSTRNNANQRLRNQEVRHFNDKMRLEDNNMNTVKQLAIDHNELQKEAREGYQHSLKDVRNKFARAKENEAARRSNIDEAWKDDVNDRIESREHRMEQQLANEKQSNIRTQHKIDQAAKTEINSVKNDYQKKFDQMEQARRDTLTQANQSKAEDISKVTKQTTDIMVKNNRDIQAKTDLEIMRNRQALESAMLENDVRDQYQREQTDARISNIRQDANQSEDRLRNNYASNIDVLKEGFEAQLRDVRLAAEKDKGLTVKAMKEEFVKKEVDHQNLLQQTVAKYEKRIGELNDQFVREKRLRDNREKQLVEQLKRGQDAQVEAVRLKYEEQNKAANIQHEKEMRDVTRRHKDQVDNIMSTVKKS
jgi:hypothetical protein